MLMSNDGDDHTGIFIIINQVNAVPLFWFLLLLVTDIVLYHVVLYCISQFMAPLDFSTSLF